MQPRRPRIRTLDDLTHAWGFIDGGHGYSAPQLFALLVDRDGWMLPNLVHLDDDDLGTDELEARLPDLVASFGRFLDEHAPGGSVAVMRARPGSPLLTPVDRRWCAALHRALQSAPFASHPVFFASDTEVGVVPPDALIPDA